MAGQTNSWIGQMQISPIPCIGDTVRKISATNQEYSSDGMFYDESVNNDSPVQNASIWWLIAIGLGIGLLVKSNKRSKQS